MNEQPQLRSEDSLLSVSFHNTVLQAIRQHARSSMDAEICGILIGKSKDGNTCVEASIQGEKASQAAAHVTFTQETWEHIYKEKDAKHPDQEIVGWYHSHPGFGVFLSGYDLFIHENFFSAKHQVAWVFDPHSDEEGAFGWSKGKVAPLPQISIYRKANGVDAPSLTTKSKDETRGRLQSNSNNEKASKEKSEETAIQKPLNIKLLLLLTGVIGLFIGVELGSYLTLRGTGIQPSGQNDSLFLRDSRLKEKKVGIYIQTDSNTIQIGELQGQNLLPSPVLKSAEPHQR